MVRADLRVEAGAPTAGTARLRSKELTIQVGEATTSAARSAKARILGFEQGLFFAFQAGDHLAKGKRQLQELVAETPNAPQAAAARLALGVSALPNVEEARKYLQGTVAAGMPTLSVAKAHAEVAATLDESGKSVQASRVRSDTLRALEKAHLQRDERKEVRAILKQR